ncbi:hypothetical protein [Maribacter sp. HTCC2170]|uniref:hypothetical protein n=1 Tax=Maribacter sp. (strain HTCC2170 / KCCM 42371) TaxID=313603 RepID=UPI0003129E9C|nr:hypothetical protein [Maribacter sp. HTCC2170]
MNLKHISIFNLIEIFSGTKKKELNNVVPKTHCDQRQHHDYYCDVEKPYTQ